MRKLTELLLVAAIITGMSIQAHAQGAEATPELDQDTLSLVLEAFSSTAETAYRFEGNYRSELTFTAENPVDAPPNNTQFGSVEGDYAAPDAYDIRRLYIGSGYSRSLVTGGERYLYLDPLFNLSIRYLFDEVPSGWWREEDLEQASGEYWQFLRSQVSAELPSGLITEQSPVLSITEDEPQTLDGQQMRVFTLMLDPVETQLRINAEQSGLSDRDFEEQLATAEADPRYETYLEQVALGSIQVRVWIGAEDGFVHQIEQNSNTYQPLAGLEISGRAFDLRSTFESETRLYNHGAAIEIVPPDESELNTP